MLRAYVDSAHCCCAAPRVCWLGVHHASPRISARRSYGRRSGGREREFWWRTTNILAGVGAIRSKAADVGHGPDGMGVLFVLQRIWTC